MYPFNRFNTKRSVDIKPLVFKAKKGDTEAFGALYEHFLGNIYRFILLKTSNKEDAEDLVHQTFLKAWDHIRFYEDQGVPFQSWLYSIARNTVIDFYRTKKTSTVLVDYLRNPLEEQRDVAHMESRIDVHMVQKHISRLNDTEQDALLLRYVEDLDHKTIAKIIQKSESATKVLVHRALGKIKLFLEES